MIKNLQFALLILVFISSGCGVSKATLNKEQLYVENLLNDWRGKSVEHLLQNNPEVHESLNLGGGKVRYSFLYGQSYGNYEYYVIYGRYRYYLLYCYVSSSGVIYRTDYKSIYSENGMRGSTNIINIR